MKILLITNMYPTVKHPSYGIFVKNTYDLLRKYHEVKVVALKKHQIWLFKAIAYLLFYLKAAIVGISGGYDCIYAHYISHCELPVRIIRYFCRKITVVGNVHGEDVFSDFEEFHKNRKKAERFLKKADYIIAPSQFFKEKIIKAYKFPQESIYVSPSGGINMAVFYPDSQSKCRKYLGLETSAYYIGYVSRIEKGKGWDTFLKAFYNIRNNGEIKSAKAVMVGSGSEETELIQMIREMGLEQHVRLYPMADQQQLHYLYNSFSLFCFPTRRIAESLGLVGIEAMACKIPCVIADMGGPRSYAEDGRNALLFDRNSAEDLEKKIMQFYNMETDKRQEMLDTAYETAQEYASEKVEGQILKIFRRIKS